MRLEILGCPLPGEPALPDLLLRGAGVADGEQVPSQGDRKQTKQYYSHVKKKNTTSIAEYFENLAKQKENK